MIFFFFFFGDVVIDIVIDVFVFVYVDVVIVIVIVIVVGKTSGNASFSGIDPVDGQKGMNGRSIVLSNVPANHIVPLQKSNRVKSIFQKRIIGNFGGKDVNGFVHV